MNILNLANFSENLLIESLSLSTLSFLKSDSSLDLISVFSLSKILFSLAIFFSVSISLSVNVWLFISEFL